MDLRETYNRIAEDWHADHHQDDWWVEGTEVFMSLLPPGSRVLDVGCGGGTKAKYLCSHGYRVTGIDIAEKLLDIAKREVPEAEFKQLSMYEVDALPESYDGVFAQASVLHIPRNDAGLVIGKLANKVGPGGLVYITVKGMKEGEPAESVLKENDYGYDYERFFSYYRPEELERYLTDSGCEIVWSEERPVGNTTWLQVIGKKGS